MNNILMNFYQKMFIFIKFDFDSENIIVNIKNNENKNNFASSKGFNHIKENNSIEKIEENKKPITEQKVNEKLMPLETEKKIMRIIIYITI